MDVEPNTLFSELPNDFFCPICETYKDDFIILDETINILDTSHHLTHFEAEHIPIYQIEEDKIYIEVGQVDHPMSDEHYIYKVALHDEDGEEIESKKLSIDDEPKLWFDIDYLDTIEIRIYCSKDGIFSSGNINISSYQKETQWW